MTHTLLEKPIDFVISCGEQSADEHTYELLKDFSLQDIQAAGMLGPQLAKLPITQWFDMQQINVMGFSSVLPKLIPIIKLFIQFRNKILSTNPKVCLFVDAPDFHIPLAKALRKRGYTGKIIQYICPTVWFWRQGRIHELNRCFDEIWGIFPFEKKMLSQKLPKLQFLENPTERTCREYQKRHKTNTIKNLDITLFPGSRPSEIELNLPTMLETISKLLKFNPDLKWALSVARDDLNPRILTLCQEKGLSNITLFNSSDNMKWMQKTRLSIAVSGTICLQLAIMKVPTFVIYRLTRVNSLLASIFLRQRPRFVSLPNIIADSSIQPELVEKHLDVDKILYWIHEVSKPKNYRKELSELEKVQEQFHSALDLQWVHNQLTQYLHPDKYGVS